MHRVLELSQGAGWSIWYKAPRYMRWLERPITDTWRGVMFVAVDSRTGRLYYENECATCNGRYLAHRVDSYFCSARCRVSHHRAKHAKRAY